MTGVKVGLDVGELVGCVVFRNKLSEPQDDVRTKRDDMNKF